MAARSGMLATLKLPGPYTQRICVPEYWPVNSLETQRINHLADIKFTFYSHKRHQSVIFSLNPASRSQRIAKMSRGEITSKSLQLTERWQTLISTNGIETRVDLARFLSVSRAKVTKGSRRLF